MTSVPDRSVDVALAEFQALRAEILAHTVSQNALLGLGFTAIGILVGLAINDPARSGLLMLVPVLCSVTIVVHAGLAYRIVVAGTYIRTELWTFLQDRCPPTDRPPSWERSLDHLEKQKGHRWRASVVEIAFAILLLVVGVASALVAMYTSGRLTMVFVGVIVLVTLVAAFITGLRLGRRAALDPALLHVEDARP